MWSSVCVVCVCVCGCVCVCLRAHMRMLWFDGNEKSQWILVAADLLLRALELSDLIVFWTHIAWLSSPFPVSQMPVQIRGKGVVVVVGGGGGGLNWKGNYGGWSDSLESLVYPATLSGMLEVWFFMFDSR